MKRLFRVFIVLLMLPACQNNTKYKAAIPDIREKVEAYDTFKLTTDLSILSPAQKEMLPLLFEAADIMDDLFWKQAWGDKESLLANIKDPDLRRYAEINYGPWDRLNDNQPFIKGIGPKPAGSQFYPQDMTMEEFEQLPNHNKTNQYTVIERDKNGDLTTVPYHEKWNEELSKAAQLLRQAASLAESKSFKKFFKELI
jgi:hypothetical protein